MNNELLIPSETILVREENPKRGEIVFLMKPAAGVPVVILDGQYTDADGRLSNFWHYRYLTNGVESSGYGCFYKPVKRGDVIGRKIDTEAQNEL